MTLFSWWSRPKKVVASARNDFSTNTLSAVDETTGSVTSIPRSSRDRVYWTKISSDGNEICRLMSGAKRVISSGAVIVDNEEGIICAGVCTVSLVSDTFRSRRPSKRIIVRSG